MHENSRNNINSAWERPADVNRQDGKQCAICCAMSSQSKVSFVDAVIKWVQPQTKPCNNYSQAADQAVRPTNAAHLTSRMAVAAAASWRVSNAATRAAVLAVHMLVHMPLLQPYGPPHCRPAPRGCRQPAAMHAVPLTERKRDSPHNRLTKFRAPHPESTDSTSLYQSAAASGCAAKTAPPCRA